jgi:hypothetical protein
MNNHRFPFSRGRELLPLAFDESQGQRLFVFFDICAQQVVHPATTALERLTVEDFNPYGALLAVDLAVRRTMFVLDELDPLPGVQRRIDELSAGIGLVVAAIEG